MFSYPNAIRPRPRVPDRVRFYAIGDIHGRLDLLDEVLARIDADIASNFTPQAIRVFLGDYIDRGPDSKRVLDRLISSRAVQPTICLMGNHEAYLRGFLKNPAILGRVEPLWRTRYPALLWLVPTIENTLNDR